MAFEFLFNRSDCEFMLIEHIARELQKKYFAYQQACFYLHLKKGPRDWSQVTEIKTFNGIKELEKYHFDTEFERACILVKYNEGKYEILTFGNHYSTACEVHFDKFTIERFLVTKADRAKIPMTPIETIRRLFAGFVEVEEELSSSVRKIAS